MNDLPSTRAGAIAAGLPTYDTGKECKNGHFSPRRTITGACIACLREATQRERDRYYAAVERRNNAMGG